ncbi:OmpA family protein [Shewanella schlegeliana]|uniref:OmpA family protein n=1 Tax=Shewanella schlegeliana TaxID=190308 RepID=A0ABS1SUT3_9GAMM|nr:OmpA family protein [Shewanella schlegeliana]MBL4912288.1 OmpA family protein [Shewanella schlegeliana]MCL1108243.1 OmpA family protein [Shewanella schlegeliana]GIU22321.1 outer membrane protein A [Shewanella schlegeliana]
MFKPSSMRSISIVLSTLLYLPLVVAYAAQLDDVEPVKEFESYFYLGAKAGLMHYQNACESWSISCDGDDVGFGGFAGYQAWQYLGFETAYLDLGEAVAHYSESGVNNTYTGSMKGWEISAVTRFSLSESFELFAKAGSLYWDGDNRGPHSRNSDSDWAPMLGAGVEYQLAPSWVARLEYQYIDSLGSELIGGSNGHLTTLGISYRFGQAATKTQPPAKDTPVTLPEKIPPVIPKPVVLPAVTVTSLFDFDSSELTNPDSLAPVIERLKRAPTAVANIKGYTDSKGNAVYNQALSERRAQAVADYLIAAGIKPEQIEVHGYGEQFPVMKNDTSEHRHENRRVLIHIQSTTSEVNPEI